MGGITKKMKYEKLKGSSGFTALWVVLALFSTYMLFYDWQVSAMGFIITFMFGFLGFDMINSICKNRTSEVQKR